MNGNGLVMRFYRGVNGMMKSKNSFKRLKVIIPVLCFTAGLILHVGTSVSTISSEAEESYFEESLSVDPTGESDGYAAILYDNTSGLPTSEANDIVETQEGALWIGSYSGLVRYDGNNFERYDSTTGITSVVSLFVDSKQRLWVGTNDNGVSVMDGGKFTSFDHIEGLKSSIRDIAEDGDGNIFVATTSGLGMVDKNMAIHDLNEEQLIGEYVDQLQADASGKIYGTTHNGAVFTIENQRITSFFSSESLGIDTIKSILPDPDKEGWVYLGTEESEIYHGELNGNLNDMEKISIAPLDTVNCMRRLDKNLWICTDNGIGFIDDEGAFRIIKNIPLDNSIDNMMGDYEGNLWFVSSRQGVMKIVNNQFTNINERYNLDTMVVNSTCKWDNYLFVGTDDGLVVLDKNGRVRSIRINEIQTSVDNIKREKNLVSLLSTSRIRSIVKDSKDRVWFSTYGDMGVVMFDHGKVVTFSKDDGLLSDKARVVYERSDGVIMAACSGGMVLIDNEKIIDTFGDESGLGNSDIMTMTEDFDGNMILGTDGNGIFIVKGHNITNIGTKDGLSSEVILRVKRDEKRKVLWLITSNSLSYIKDGKVETVSTFPYSNNFDMYENKSGDLWILSSNGIYVVSADDIIGKKNISPTYYGINNGLPCVSTANSYSCVDDEGNMYISGMSGVAKVNIDKMQHNVEDIRMSVPYVDADGKYIYTDKNGKIIIPSSVKRLTIYDYVYTYSLMDPKVSYCLEGFDKDFVTVARSEMEPVVYTNLDGGTYTFVMKLQNDSDEEKTLSVTIEKQKATYEYVWFKLVLAFCILLILILVVFAYVRSKTLALLKKEEENKIFIREMIEAFAKTIDMKDKYTNGHSTRVAEYTAMLTRELGYDENTVDKYYNIALLHDIGKIGIPPEVLNKPGKLTDLEFNIIKSHSAQGYKVLKDISIMPELAIGAGAHHERPDGKGYPKGLKGDEIPRVAQIIAVADTFDAMYSDRPYRKRMNFDKAVSIIKEVSGTQLTEDVVDAFLRLVERGYFKAEDDNGGGTTEDINNIHKKFNEQKS